MNTDLTPEEGDLLERFVSGDLTREAVRTQMAASAPFRKAIEELEHMKAVLDGVRTHDEQDLATIRASVTEEDRRIVREALEPWLAPRARRAWRFAAALLCAAVVLFLGLQRGWFSSAPPHNDGQLGGELRVRPQGPSASLGSFSVECTLAPLQRVYFVLYDEGGIELLRSPGLATTTWQLAPEQLERLPVRVAWTYEVQDPSGNSSFGGPFQAWRSP